MKNFWPNRSKANGFSIQNLAREYRLKISGTSCGEVLNQSLDNNDSKSTKNKTNNISVVNISIKRTHWANRDFSEYKEAA
tara:strand:- start:854 stop:1093 length:240 start_codon:yes stop_codon:yes gene_type:complete